MNIVKTAKIFLWISAFMVVVSLVAIFTFRYNLGIDFAGGSTVELDLGEAKEGALPQGMGVEAYLESTFREVTGEETAAQRSTSASEVGENNRYQFRSKEITNEDKTAWMNRLRETYPSLVELSFTTVSPTIGGEVIRKAVYAVVLTLIAILLYLAYAFRRVPKPTSSWQFGVAAVVTLLAHDVIMLLGAYAVLSHFWGAEVDSMFLTALLTLLGFSVHDTIVTFDRIRENLIHRGDKSFEDTVNDSIIETLTRSINTSFTLALVLLAMTLIGGGTTFFFTIALLIGVVLGVYSSIFVAAPLLMLWHRKS